MKLPLPLAKHSTKNKRHFFPTIVVVVVFVAAAAAAVVVVVVVAVVVFVAFAAAAAAVVWLASYLVVFRLFSSPFLSFLFPSSDRQNSLLSVKTIAQPL